MTVSNLARRVAYSGNGATKTFAVPFQFSEIGVYVGGVLKTLGTDYNISQTSEGSTGSITFGTAPAALAQVVIVGSTDLVQDTDLVDNDSAPAETYEAALDRLTMAIQDAMREASLAIRLPRYSDAVDPIDFSASPNSVLGTDDEGNVALLPAIGPGSPFEGAVADITDLVATAQTSATAAQSSATDAQGFRDETEGFRNEASDFRDSAADASNTAQAALASVQTGVQDALSLAQGYRDEAQGFRDDAAAIAAGDLSASLIANDSGVTGATIAEALDQLASDIGEGGATSASELTNDSGVDGANVAAALDTLDAAIADKADAETTLAGYGITDAYTKTEVDDALGDKADGSRVKAPTVQVFTSSGTWTKPTGCVKIKATVVGGGGGGGGVKISSSRYAAAGGGCSGATVVKYLDVTSIASLPVTVGAGGLGGDEANGVTGNPGAAGGDSSLGSAGVYGLARGGNSGSGRSLSQDGALAGNILLLPAGAAVTGSNGDWNGGSVPGGTGFAFGAVNAQISGQGGDGPYGGGASPIRLSGSSIAGNGADGAGPGSGGSGACVTANATSVVGGDGADGIVIIEEYYA